MKTINNINKISGIILLVFAFVTIFMSSSVIFDWFELEPKKEIMCYLLFGLT